MNLTHMLGSVENWWKVVMAVAGEALNFIGYLFYAIFTGVGMLINFVLSLFKKLAGIESMTLTATSTLGEDKGITKQITVGGEGNWTDVTYAFITSDTVRTTFWTIFAMCIALLVVFTIFAIVKSEFSTDVKNAAKLPILERAVKSVINFLLIPVLSIASLYGANMLTKAIFYSLNSDSDYYITNVIFNAGATQANRASLDDGFANFLLTDEAVYFANEDVVKPRDAVMTMMSNYFNTQEGEIVVFKYKKTGEGVTSSEIVAQTTLTKDFQTTTSSLEDPYHLNYLRNNKSKYDYSESKYYAGKFFYRLKDRSGKKIGDEWYEWSFQVPVETSYINQDEGFRQTIYGIARTLGEGGSSYDPAVATYVVTNVTAGRDDFYECKMNYVFQKSKANKNITADDVASWFGQENCLQACKALSEVDRTQIASVANEYNRALSAEDNKSAAKQSVGLWEVLQHEYNTEERKIFDAKPTFSDAGIQQITQEQRNCLVKFINRIFVGSGNGTSSYRLYKVNQANSENTTFTAEKPADGVDYLEISSATLHIEKYSQKTWKKIYADTKDWSSNYTPDVQQNFWRPSTYSGEAVMDIGLVGYFYKFNNMNLVMMLFGMVAIAWQYFKLILVFVKRALEMVLLFLMAPVVTAIAPLDKGNAENSWRSNWIKQLTMTAVPVFAINIFFTIVPLVTSIAPFGATAGSVINPLYTTYNAFVSIIFIYVGVSMINRASSLLAGFLGTEDMIATGKDLTGKATGIADTATKGAALVAGVTLAGPAAVIKRGYSMAKGRKARNDSLLQSRKDALGDINDQIKSAEQAGDVDQAYSLKQRRDNYDDFAKMSKSSLQEGFNKAMAKKDDMQSRVDDTESKIKENDDLIAQKQEELRKLKGQRLTAFRNAKKNDIGMDEEAIKREFNEKQKDIEDEIKAAEYRNSIYKQNLEVQKRGVSNATDDERFYSNLMESQQTAKQAGKVAKESAKKEADNDGTMKALEAGHKKLNNSMLGNAISHIPGLNWAVNKVAFGALGLGAQVADRKFFSDTPKVAMDFVKGVNGDAGKIAEKFIDPGTIGKVISTDEENTFRNTVKEEKARKKAWEEQIKFEDDKLKKQQKAQDEFETKRQLKEYERYKLGAYNVEGGKMTVNADKAETIAKNYEKTINTRADQDFKNNVQKDDKNFAKFKQMLKEMEDENKKKAQNVKIDPRDKGFGEQVIKAMKTVNAQNNRELKNINSGITSLSKNIEDLVKKMQ